MPQPSVAAASQRNARFAYAHRVHRTLAAVACVVLTSLVPAANVGAQGVTYSVGTNPLLTYSETVPENSSGTRYLRTNENGTGTSQNVYYNVQTINIATAGQYNFASFAGRQPAANFGGTIPNFPVSWRNALFLYEGAFDPGVATDNFFFGDVSGIGGGTGTPLPTQVGQSSFTRNLVAGTYQLVTAGFATADVGSFHNMVNRVDAQIAVPDNSSAGVSRTITVNDLAGLNVGQVNSVTIRGLRHRFAGDLRATLTHQGVSVELFARPGPGNDGSFSGAFNGDYTFALAGADLPTALPPSYPSSAAFGVAPGTYKAKGNFGNFAGLLANGDWTLRIADEDPTATGYFTGFEFNVVAAANVPEIGSLMLTLWVGLPLLLVYGARERRQQRFLLVAVVSRTDGAQRAATHAIRKGAQIRQDLTDVVPNKQQHAEAERNRIRSNHNRFCQ